MQVHSDFIPLQHPNQPRLTPALELRYWRVLCTHVLDIPVYQAGQASPREIEALIWEMRQARERRDTPTVVAALELLGF